MRVIKNGSWGFAAGVDLTSDAAAAIAARAMDVAGTLAPLNVEPVVLADEPVYTDSYVSRCDIDPFTVPEQDKVNFLLALNDRQLASGKVDHVTSYVILAAEQKFLASLAGSRILQQRAPILGENRVACTPIEQRHTELDFQIGERLTDDGLRAPQLPAGSRKAALFGGGDKGAELIQRYGVQHGRISIADGLHRII